jgi:hypothetical protein
MVNKINKERRRSMYATPTWPSYSKKFIYRTLNNKFSASREQQTMSVPSPLSENESAAKAHDIFRMYPNQVAIPRYYQEDVRPVSQFDGTDAPLEFETSLQGDTYCELPSCRLFLKVRILHADGIHCSDDIRVSPCDSFFHSMSRNVDFTSVLLYFLVLRDHWCQHYKVLRIEYRSSRC